MSASVANACPRHPGVAAQYTCSRCQQPCCLNCCYSMPDGSICCAPCYSKPQAAAATTPSVSSFQATPTSTPARGCLQHPLLPPVAFCKVCGKGSCVTCDFFFPPNIHLCPECVVSSQSALTPLRKKYMVSGLIMAVWSSIGEALLLGGAFASLTQGIGMVFLVELLIRAIIIIPCAIGTGLAWAALKKGGPNPIGIWVALVWNSLLSGVLILVMIFTMFMRT